jgi:CO/xanthine dehydrogenase Mo-binding subunit/aerobic-type carbon monoxide dehydrogenase small subunit (CoxS/CutS family)
MTVRLVVNGEAREIGGPVERSLLGVLRGDLGLIGPKLGCGEGECGTCTVLVDGEPVRACMTALAEVAERAVTTVEGLGTPMALHRVQRAFLEEAAFQCAYCTPGMVVAAAALLDRVPHPTDAQVRAALEGNICRCGTHPRIVRAVRRAADLGSAATPPGDAAAEPRGGDAASAPMSTSAWDLTQDTDALFAVLGDGLLVVPDGSGGVWLHVAADGTATIASGKVDVGQGSRAELTGVAAEALRVPGGQVRAILGDTDLAPYDMGTFGSRTTPDIVPAAAAAGASAREALLRLAGEAWGMAPASLIVADACIRTVDGSRSISYGELVAGGRRVKPVRDLPSDSATPHVAGSGAAAPIRGPDAMDAVTGRRAYASDLALPGMLHGAVVRPPSFGARLLAVDTAAAEALPGVRVVHEGDFVAVAAPSRPQLMAALKAIRATWKPGTIVAEAGLEAHLRAHPVEARGWGGTEREETGDVDAALDAAPIRVDATYTTAYLAHEPLETRAALASWEGDRLTVWTGGQRPFGVREELATALGLDEGQVRVIAAPTGSAYGGKHTGDAALEAARIARTVGAPVKVRWTRAEETTWGYFRPAAVIDVRAGARADGELTAWEIVDLNAGGRTLEPPYRVPSRRLVYQPAASPLRQGSYRALSATANTFARESHVDELAHRVGADPLELRLRLCADDRLADVLRAASEEAGWAAWMARHDPGHGLGIAGSIEKDARVATCVEVRAAVGEPLEIVRIVTAFECGAIVDRDNLDNQVAGAVVMGLGGALFEAVHFEDGMVTNATQAAYRVPRFSDVPPITVILLDRPDLPSAGAGETPLIALAPAIANAIFAATGVRLRSLPLVPDGVLPAPAWAPALPPRLPPNARQDGR